MLNPMPVDVTLPPIQQHVAAVYHCQPVHVRTTKYNQSIYNERSMIINPVLQILTKGNTTYTMITKLLVHVTLHTIHQYNKHH